MKLVDIFRMAFGNLKRNRMRTVLTVSGVVVGIGAIVFLVSLGFGLQALLVSKVANLEALTVITVRPGSKENTDLTSSTAERFKALKGVKSVGPTLSYPAQIAGTNGKGGSETVLYGVVPELFDLEDIRVDYGSELSSENASEVILSAASISALNLNNPNDVIGKTLEFKLKFDKPKESGNTLRLKVVGLTNENKVKYAYTPLGVIKGIDGEKYSSIKVKAGERKDVSEIRKAIESMGFPTSSIKDTVDQIDQAFVVIRSVLAGFGLIALFVAAIGIFNTMTISLLERTHEIGIMKAIGGRNRDVALIFTAEAAIIGILGGAFGVLTGWLLGEGINSLVNFIAISVEGQASDIFYTPLNFIGIVIAFAFIVSTFAGIWPARRASKLNPLEALRYE